MWECRWTTTRWTTTRWTTTWRHASIVEKKLVQFGAGPQVRESLIAPSSKFRKFKFVHFFAQICRIWPKVAMDTNENLKETVIGHLRQTLKILSRQETLKRGFGKLWVFRSHHISPELLYITLFFSLTCTTFSSQFPNQSSLYTHPSFIFSRYHASGPGSSNTTSSNGIPTTGQSSYSLEWPHSAWWKRDSVSGISVPIS